MFTHSDAVGNMWGTAKQIDGICFTDAPSLIPTRDRDIMKPVSIFSKSTLREFWEAGHAEVKDPLLTWHDVVSRASWMVPSDVKQRYPSASFLNDNRVIFNLKGNKYRLITDIDYARQRLFIRFVGTHAEYDRIDAKTI
jgi:mRNA interferase HigB